MAKVFISYSRKDIVFAKQLTGELQKCEMDFWIDWEGIPPTVDWWKEIEKGIEEADIFLFLISPDSSASKVCGQEIDTAVKNAKRIIPLVVRDIQGNEAPKQLSHLNWIFCRESDDFEAALNKLLTAVRTDYEWAATHRRLQVKALDWERNNKDNGFLLRGMDLLDAERDLAMNTSKDPYPSDLQREYVFESRKATDRQRRIVTWLSLAAAIMLAALAAFGFFQANQANKQAAISRSQALIVSAQLNPDLVLRNLLLHIAAYDLVKDFSYPEKVMAEQALRDSLGQVSGDPLTRPECPIKYLAFSPDGQWMATGSSSNTGCLWNAKDFTAAPIVLHAQDIDFSVPVFSPESRWLVTANCTLGYVGACGDTTLNVWDLQDPLVTPIVMRGPANNFTSNPVIRPGGRWVITTDYSTVYLWDIQNPDSPPKSLSGHEDNITSFAVSPDGRWLATGSVDATARLWDLDDDSQESILFPGIEAPINTVAFSPDGQWLAAGGTDGDVHLWEFPETSSEPELLSGGAFPGQAIPAVDSIAFSQDGRWLAMGNSDRVVHLWNMQDRASGPTVLDRSGDSVKQIFFSPDGQWLAATGESNDIRLWDISQARLYQRAILLPSHQNTINSAAFSPDGRWLAATSDDTIARLWDMKSTSPDLLFLQGLDAAIDTVQFSPDGRWLVLQSSSGTGQLWNMQGASPTPFNRNTNWYRSTFSTDSRWLAYETCSEIDDLNGGCVKNTLMLQDMNAPSGKPRLLYKGDGNTQTFIFSADANWLAAGADKTVRVWKVNDATFESVPLQGEVEFLAFSPASHQLAAGGCAQIVETDQRSCEFIRLKIWDLTQPTPELVRELDLKADFLQSLTFSPDGRWLAATSSDKTGHLWDLKDPAAESILLNGVVERLSFSPDGHLLAIAGCVEELEEGRFCGQTSVRLWDTKDPTSQPRELKLKIDFVSFLVFSPDSRWLAISDASGVVPWDLKDSSAAPDILRDHTDGIYAMLFTPDSKWLATGSHDSTVRLRNMQHISVDPIILNGHQDTVRALAFSPDGQWLVTGSNDMTARMWTMDASQLSQAGCRLVGRNFTRDEWKKNFPGNDYPTNSKNATCPHWTLDTETISIPVP